MRRWRKQCDQLFSCGATRMAFTGPQAGRHHEVEAKVADFIRKQRANRALVSKVLDFKCAEWQGRLLCGKKAVTKNKAVTTVTLSKQSAIVMYICK